MNRRTRWRQALAVLAVVLILWAPAVPAGFLEGLTLEKEKQLGEEFFLELQKYYTISDDPFITSYINRVGRRLAAQAGVQFYPYRFFVLDDPTLNAMAVPGGYIFVTTGFIRAMEREGELAAVLAHEISHLHARHLSRQLEKGRNVGIATLVGSLAAVLLGGPAAAAILTTTQAAGQSVMLKYSREHEFEADSLGFKWMVKAGYHPRDMLSVFRKLSKQRWFQGGDIPVYLSTHPHTDERLAELSNQMHRYEGQLPPERPSPEFDYFALKVEATCGKPQQFLRRMTQACIREPQNPVNFYGKGLALARLERSEEALAAFQQGLALDPGNRFLQREMAIHLLERNRSQQALPLLLRLIQKDPQDEVTLYYLGLTYMQNRQLDQALAAFERVQTLNPAFIAVYHNLGIVYGEKGRLGLAHYFLGLHSLKARAYPTALFHFQKALVNLPATDPHYPEVRQQIARLEKLKVRVD